MTRTPSGDPAYLVGIALAGMGGAVTGLVLAAALIGLLAC